MKLTVFRMERQDGAKDYRITRDTGLTIIRETFEEVLTDLRRVATEARNERRVLSVSVVPDEIVIQHRRSPVLFHEALTADEQRAVRELFRSIPIPDTL